MPALSASCVVRICTGVPSMEMVPSSLEYTPVSTLMSVDLPAPFSPISAWISPLRRVKSTPSSARTPGKNLQIPRNSSKAVSCIVFASIVACCVQRGYTECSIYAVPHAAEFLIMRCCMSDQMP